MKDKKEGQLKVMFRATQKGPFLTLNGLENTINMITMYITNRGPRAAVSALVLRWADVCNVSAFKLVGIIVEDEIFDSEIAAMNEQAEIPNDGKSKLPNATYVAEYLSEKLSLLHSNPKHLANHRIYDEIFDTIHTAYLTMYNQKYAMNTLGYKSKKAAIHEIGKNYHLDSVLYPTMINTMVQSGYTTFFKKAAKNERVKSMLLDAVIDEDFSLKLIDEYPSAEEYDKVMDERPDYTTFPK